MIAKVEIREEREDVYSFWEDKKSLNDNDEIVVEEVKIEECTVLEIEKRIEETQQQIIDLTAKIALENSKIHLINSL
jgi:phosphoribosylformylglycinamidine (FGAM) synthase PurS component